MSPKIWMHQLGKNAVPFEPAARDRPFMDATYDRYAYRCLPMSIANQAGWEFLCPSGFEAEWAGGVDAAHVTVRHDDPAKARFCNSHFGSGTITFHTDWLPMTKDPLEVEAEVAAAARGERVEAWPGRDAAHPWAMFAMGSPNHLKHGIQPLAGVVETDWLPFAFTMNWRFTAPGKVRFEAGEPFCFVTLIQLTQLEATEVLISDINDYPGLKAQNAEWSRQRHEFVRDLRAGTPEALAKKWQRDYMQGRMPQGTVGQDPHVHFTKLDIDAGKPAQCPFSGSRRSVNGDSE